MSAARDLKERVAAVRLNTRVPVVRCVLVRTHAFATTHPDLPASRYTLIASPEPPRLGLPMAVGGIDFTGMAGDPRGKRSGLDGSPLRCTYWAAWRGVMKKVVNGRDK